MKACKRVDPIAKNKRSIEICGSGNYSGGSVFGSGDLQIQEENIKAGESIAFKTF